ncbi:hypothetical protein Bbelb_204730 [Branchiostoma belcheri]|nr:hypothetical protein Bbelb_204730 [Branchiostoma belcheri]
MQGRRYLQKHLMRSGATFGCSRRKAGVHLFSRRCNMWRRQITLMTGTADKVGQEGKTRQQQCVTGDNTVKCAKSECNKSLGVIELAADAPRACEAGVLRRRAVIPAILIQIQNTTEVNTRQQVQKQLKVKRKKRITTASRYHLRRKSEYGAGAAVSETITAMEDDPF